MVHSLKTDVTPLPTTPAETAARGWDSVDVVFVTGDAYVDHPSFAMALLGRVLESEGFRVAILSQPDWRSCDAWRTFGRPRLCFAVSAGNMDSMLNHYTAARKVRNDDAYSPDGEPGRRPDRATPAYCQRAREAYRGVPVIAGGVEASLRRLAHYDYWSDKVRRSILLDAKTDLLVYGMGERPLVEIVKRLAAGEPIRQLRDIRGVAYRLGAKERNYECGMMNDEYNRSLTETDGLATIHNSSFIIHHSPAPRLLPSYEEVSSDKSAFVAMTRMIHEETNPYNARALIQYHGREAVVVNPPAWPLAQEEMDRVYNLPFTRRPHPSYGRSRVPAFEVVKDSIQIARGCFGGCSFCSITLHQGRVVQSRGEESILAEIGRMAGQPDFSGTISDLGGPTANMYRMNCSRPEEREKCRRTSCLWPAICPRLTTDHGPLVRLLKAARRCPGVKRALVASGIRMDLALRSPAFIRHVARHHTGGLLKVAPEHSDPEVLRRMHKPPIEQFEDFGREFRRQSAEAGKRQFLVPYFIAGHPGCDLNAMISLALYIKRRRLKPDKVQDFLPVPMDVATCMYYTGIDPISGEEVYVPRGARQRRLQRALLQFFVRENYPDVREALEEAGRPDLIGDGPDCLIPSRPPKVSAARKPPPRRERKQEKPAAGYRPHRKTAKRRKHH
ncbi:MAG: YgiQ family radical SAM protein [Planctomycetes bacterium]|nr:YgiQ family radical SAM protein [Planctomycetota bacterium]